MSILLFVLAVSNCEISSNHNKKLKSYTLLAATRNKSTNVFLQNFHHASICHQAQNHTLLQMLCNRLWKVNTGISRHVKLLPYHSIMIWQHKCSTGQVSPCLSSCRSAVEHLHSLGGYNSTCFPEFHTYNSYFYSSSITGELKDS